MTLYDYSTDYYGNYSDHNFEDDSICASYWMELHDHKDFTQDECWRIIPLAVYRDDVCVVIYDKGFHIIRPVVGEIIEFNHKLLHGLLPLEIAKHLEGKKRKTKGYLDWHNRYVADMMIKENRSKYPVMEWRFV